MVKAFSRAEVRARGYLFVDHTLESFKLVRSAVSATNDAHLHLCQAQDFLASERPDCSCESFELSSERESSDFYFSVIKWS